MRRAFDLFWTVVGLVVLFPVLLAISAAIKLDDGGAIFFRQERVGRFGRPFRIWKFRTMRPDAERVGGSLTLGRDPRVTRVGHHLRRLKLDELPQLFNVLSGEMSLVGPRPEVPRYVALYTPQQRRVLDLVPGITDMASIKYRRENEILAAAADPERTYVEEIMPEKIWLNLSYATDRSVRAALRVILLTLAKVFFSHDDAPARRDGEEQRIGG